MTATVRRALILAGGGLKVAYQAGVLQVWLDEAGMDMQLATGSSGGTLNLAMWSQGYTGRQIADAWRDYKPLAAASVSRGLLRRGPFAPAMLSGRGLRRKIFPAFGLDWHAIRTSAREAVFDVYNFTAHEHRAVGPAELTEDLLVSAVSLPWWFDPVRVGSDTYIDAVFATDSNLEEAIRRGATELWVVWTVGTGGIWRGGFVNGYFQMIEAMANAELRAGLRRIEESNRAIDENRPGHYPHRVTVRMLAAEVPMHYLLVLRNSQVRRAVELGVADARRWCRERGIPLLTNGFSGNGCGTVAGNGTPPVAAGISFRERMSGSLRLAEPEQPATPCELRLEITIADVEEFAADPEHRGRVHGTVVCPALGGTLPIRSGTVNLLVEKAIGDLRMIYELIVPAADGRELLLRGEKFVHHDTGPDLWRDTTTLHTIVLDPDGSELAAGILRLSPAGLLRQLASMRADRLGALSRFLGFFLGRLADTYLKAPQPRATPAWLRAAVNRK
ncbi:MAG TPA: patatin-like phospholipase family protein [Actinophytocola sp.]|uniref:patatin-like phospholipase family protein n=1 Tax=Actinophytocola sp. TaxID=1872138 RepID=UPI002DBD6874|nr:patatin-like phospholipase family protein [Actinophytocola sp.]HEU5473503.1 patatin-like phospholipase family protein [Actinophytocola sp.]